MPTKPPIWNSRSVPAAIFISLFFFMLTACATELPSLATREPSRISLTVDGQVHNLISDASNVRELLEEAGIDLGQSDLVEPPLFTPITKDLEITITRVSESIELISQAIPYQRRTVRNESLSAQDPPVIVQGGSAGLMEITIRIVYHDGLEISRQETQTVVIEQAKDEIVMIGVGVSTGSVDFPGILAFISGGSSVIMRGSNIFPQQLETGEDLDRRVFSLSPTGSHLLYTRAMSGTNTFNSLWVIPTERGGEPKPLDINNVLWADWNPDRPTIHEIAYTTALATELLPGWEANNDLWLAELNENNEDVRSQRQIIESYPATYGWWGGNYSWSPDGQSIAYGFADEVGLINVRDLSEDRADHTRLMSFTEYNTRAEWVWVPSLSWSPDGSSLAFVAHSGTNPLEAVFDTWVIQVDNRLPARFVEHSGIWSYPRWSSHITNSSGINRTEVTPESHLAVLRATDPLESLRSSYTLWLMDRDGSNARQIYPPAGENSRFPRDEEFMAWGPLGNEIAFVYDDDLYVINLTDTEARRITQDDAAAANPTWAPYGAGVGYSSEKPVEVDAQEADIDPFLDDRTDRYPQE